MADPEQAEEEYDVAFTDLDAFPLLDAIVLAVPHRQYLDDDAQGLLALLKPGGVVVDVKSALRLENPGLAGHALWSL
jgi:UDP-N-acetyl-D-galactosamine dehydrogenase